MSSTGTGSVGSKDDQNLIDADDGDTDGGDDQHGHHPNLV